MFPGVFRLRAALPRTAHGPAPYRPALATPPHLPLLLS
jgi:hypothetical protein